MKALELSSYVWGIPHDAYTTLSTVSSLIDITDDYIKMFDGNTDDCFRIGVQLSKSGLKLYADFYKADILVCSPLGLRLILGAEG